MSASQDAFQQNAIPDGRLRHHFSYWIELKRWAGFCSFAMNPRVKHEDDGERGVLGDTRQRKRGHTPHG